MFYFVLNTEKGFICDYNGFGGITQAIRFCSIDDAVKFAKMFVKFMPFNRCHVLAYRDDECLANIYDVIV